MESSLTSNLSAVDMKLDIMEAILDGILNNSLPKELNIHSLYGYVMTLKHKLEDNPFSMNHFQNNNNRDIVRKEYESRYLNVIALLESVEILLDLQCDLNETIQTIQEQYDESIEEEINDRVLIQSLQYLVEPLDEFPTFYKTFGYSHDEDAQLSSILSKQFKTNSFTEFVHDDKLNDISSDSDDGSVDNKKWSFLDEINSQTDSSSEFEVTND